jgi:hypothetical protein
VKPMAKVDVVKNLSELHFWDVTKENVEKERTQGYRHGESIFLNPNF